jgi:sugar O-acyltransferase (sialic acid O-acetyltransferase NeuD family)
MTNYVMFGHSPLFGDLVDLICANGGCLKKVVQNIPETVRPGTKSLAVLIADQDARRAKKGLPPIVIETLENFQSKPDERYLIGFRGAAMIPLLSLLKERFNLSFPVLAHPSAVISPTALLGEGTFVGAGAVVASGVRIGRFALLNRGCTVGHDCVVGDFANIGPGANLASFAEIGTAAVIGIGATVLNWVRVGSYSIVAAGAVALDHVPEETLVAGVPAKPKKKVPRNQRDVSPPQPAS